MWLLLLLLLSCTFLLNCAYVIERTKSGDSSSDQSRFKPFVKSEKIKKLPEVPRLSNPSDVKSLDVPGKATFDPCSTSGTVCVNGGRCENRDGNFVCHCPSTHYGKRCEILADLRKCENNLCKNGAACVSTPTTREVLDPSKSSRNKKTLSEQDMSSMMLTIQYDCVCAPGYMGPLCELSERELSCQENFCLGHGTGTIVNDKCTCDCHDNYLGNRCETENPCTSFECFNSGICTPQIDHKRSTVEAKCTCPSTSVIPTKISGDQCDTISLSHSTDATSQLMPCTNDGNYMQWHNAMMTKIDASDKPALQAWLNSCKDDKNVDCKNDIRLTKGWCINSDQCEARVVTFASNNAYLFPICLCKGADSGKFCEYARTDECDPTREEKAAGVTRETRCTDVNHGTCVDIQGEVRCDCRSGFVGENCETYDPCVSNPCNNAECVPIPSETIVVNGQPKNNYRCICAMEDDLQDASTCVFRGSGNCTSHSRCHRGDCLTCEHTDEEQMLQLCTEKEQKDGFKCVCEPGFLPPYCEKVADSCDENLCENGADCIVESKYDYSCKCLPGTHGSLCEEIVDFCLAFGNSRCVHGGCVEDAAESRGFSCVCQLSAFGRNCEFAMGWMTAAAHFLMTYYQFTMPLLSIVFTMLVLTCAYFCCAAGRPRSAVCDLEQSSKSEMQNEGIQEKKEKKLQKKIKKKSVDRKRTKLLEKRRSPTDHRKANDFHRPPPTE